LHVKIVIKNNSQILIKWKNIKQYVHLDYRDFSCGNDGINMNGREQGKAMQINGRI
jgi:hypothetical protein